MIRLADLEGQSPRRADRLRDEFVQPVLEQLLDADMIEPLDHLRRRRLAGAALALEFPVPRSRLALAPTEEGDASKDLR